MKLTVFLLHDAGFESDILDECKQIVCQDYRHDAKSGDKDDEYVGGVLSIHCRDK